MKLAILLFLLGGGIGVAAATAPQQSPDRTALALVSEFKALCKERALPPYNYFGITLRHQFEVHCGSAKPLTSEWK